MNILAAVSLVAILVFIHEFGHYIVAKMCGVHVKIFSLGYGRRVIGFEHGGTDYRISLLPFGGYVMMAGADPFGYGDEDDHLLEDPETSFMRRPVWQRLLIMAAGPAFNLGLPVVVFTALLMAGDPQAAPSVGSVASDSPAEEAGLQPGDRFVQIAGQEVTTWSGMSDVIGSLGAGDHELVVLRDGAEVGLSVHLDADEAGALGISYYRIGNIVGVDDPDSPAGRAGIQTEERVVAVDGEETADWIALAGALRQRAGAAAVELTVADREGAERTVTVARQADWAPRADSAIRDAASAWGLYPGTVFVADVSDTVEDAGVDLLGGCQPGPAAPPSPAMQNGIEPGDRFFRLDGEPVAAWDDVLDGVRATMVGEKDEATARAMQVELIRDGELLSLEITPKVIQDTDALGDYMYRPVLGAVRAGEMSAEGPTVRVYYPFGLAVTRSVEETVNTAGFIVRQLGKLITGEAAVEKNLGGPVEIVRQASKAAEKGLFTWARMMALLSISLGIVNLVPVPVLDGGQILFYLAEAVRGRPLPHALRERAQQLGVLFLVMLMLAVLVFDIQRLFEG